MNHRGTCCLLMALQLLLLSVAAHGAALDDYYLAKFDKTPPRGTQAAALPRHSHGTGERCRTHLYHGLKKSWKQLESETQKTLAMVLAEPALSNEQRFHSPGGHFTIHFASSGTDAPPPADGNGNGIPEWVEEVATVFEEVYAKATDNGIGMKYAAAPTDDGRYHIYLENIGTSQQVYGITRTGAPAVNGDDRSFTSFITIDNDFSTAEYGDYYSAGELLRITAAHEYLHAIQFGYNIWFEAWYGEATATWIEDELYDDVNQLYDYLYEYIGSSTPVKLDLAVEQGGGYSRWIFGRHLAERFTPSIIRETWEQLAQVPSTHADVPMLPLIDAVLTEKGSSLNDEFSRFARKLYERNWTSHTDDTSRIRPVSTIASYSSYPVNSSSVPAPSVTLPAYSFAYYAFQPPSATLADLVLTPAATTGIRTTALKKAGDGTISAYTADENTGAITVPSFNAPGMAASYLLISNSSSSEASCSTTGTLMSLPASYGLEVATAGTGTGSVNSSPSGIACSTGSTAGCSASFSIHSTVELFATPDSSSIFAGWSGACTNTTGKCTMTMDNSKNTTATFNRQAPASIAGSTTGYATLQQAYAAAQDNATIQLMEATDPGALTAGRPINVTLIGGYDAGYTESSGMTVIQGTIRLRGGKVVAKRVKVK